MKRRKLLRRIVANMKNVKFTDFVNLVEGFGFKLDRISGSHHIFKHPGIPELINLQEVNGEAKPYQIKQFLRLTERYDLSLEDD
ncbi:MAG: type II toxin-antitoxin system HicA family toxin [bacterium]|nr:type II toxin-antitoxin system HicA family toxin [candidate division KSB1 bacterium]